MLTSYIENGSKASSLSTKELADAYANRGFSSRNMDEDGALALLDYNRALSLDNRHYVARFNRLHLYLDRCDFTRAIHDIEILQSSKQALESLPTYVGSLKTDMSGNLRYLERAAEYCSGWRWCQHVAVRHIMAALEELPPLRNHADFQHKKMTTNAIDGKNTMHQSRRMTPTSALHDFKDFVPLHLGSTLSRERNLVDKELENLGNDTVSSLVNKAYDLQSKKDSLGVEEVLLHTAYLINGHGRLRTLVALWRCHLLLERGNKVDAFKDLQILIGEVENAQAANKKIHDATDLMHEDESDMSPLFNLAGTIKEEDGDHDGAREMYAKAVELDPTNIFAQLNFGIMQLERGFYYDAFRAYEQIIPGILKTFSLSPLQTTLHNSINEYFEILQNGPSHWDKLEKVGNMY